MLKETLCRPDEQHWCVECCSLRGCSLLMTLADGTRGCAGHNVNSQGLRKTLFCQEFNCVKNLSDKSFVKLQRKISGLPTGEFKMGSLLKKTH